ncbi:contactin-associated protein-like 2 [Pocillopora damicornis]|uniref:contactin-associated protein-like 2 n=1 Tax=Pocillopora damicornis TaxID=46731 RepID=UPI000F5547C4|nr:contactin-associated protein-like 2 [Pocillopora damicornis]
MQAKRYILKLPFLLFPIILVPITAHNYVDGRSGLIRGVRVPGTRVSYGNFAVDKYHRLQVSVGLSSVVSNYRECALSCVNNPPCSSFNVASSPRLDGQFPCELLNEDKYSASPGQLVSSQEYHHYSIRTPCSSWPCQNGGKCIPNYEKGEFTCSCKPGFSGETCLTDVDECSSNPCANGGTCVDSVNGYLCQCAEGFADTNCSSSASTPKTCAGVNLQNPGGPSGYYTIDPDGFGGLPPFSVYCDLHGRWVMVSFTHDVYGVEVVDGYEEPGSFIRDVTYSHSLQQMAAAISVSENCRQLISYTCSKSRIMANYGDLVGGPYTWWVARDGTRQNYWGGADPSSYSCGCYKAMTCYKFPKFKCNCDANDLGERTDYGYLTDKSKLPVTQLRFGDTGSNDKDKGKYSLGPLHCVGEI